MNAETVRNWMWRAAESLHEERDYLTQLDAAIGDADHGTNMDRGFAAVVEKFDGLDGSESPGQLLTTAGGTLASTVGGASGPLWGTAFRRAGQELGAAEQGDKTMVDALAPALRALRERIEAGAPVLDALAASRIAGEEGMRTTVALQASKGRASYLGDRSIGHQDPGATSTVFILAALEEAVTAAA
jgi:phosphoenolpyruvate---glycerone phosphotransferase subunit DhaL